MPKQKRTKLEEKKLYAFLATILSIIGVIIVIAKKKKDDYVMFYAKQSIVVFIVSFFAGIIGSLSRAIFPIVGDVIYAGLSILTFLAWLVSWLYALSGEKKEVPIIGEYAREIKL